MNRLFLLLKNRFHPGFDRYDPEILEKAIQGRMEDLAVPKVGEYIRMLLEDGEEWRALFRGLTGGKSALVRSPEALERWSGAVSSHLFGREKGQSELRVWVPACGTGEYAYTVGMFLLDEIERSHLDVNLLVFATVSDPDLLETAYRGEFREAEFGAVSAAYRERFFVRNGERWEAGSRLRRALVFSRHDLLEAPPFARLDMVFCRDIVGRLKPDARREVLGWMCGALAKRGMLFSGHMGSLENLEAELEAVDAECRGVFRRRCAVSAESRVAHLEQELCRVRASLERSVQELEASNHKLLVADEGRQLKIAELKRRTDDFNDLMGATQIGAIFTDKDFRIRFYTPEAAKFYNILPQDIGRSLDHFMPRIKGDDAIAVARYVDEHRVMHEKHVATEKKEIFLRRISPYHNASGEYVGLSLVYIDVTEASKAESRARTAHRTLQFAADSANIGIWEWNLVTGNAVWDDRTYEIYGFTRADAPVITFDLWSRCLNPEDAEEQVRRLDYEIKTRKRAEVLLEVNRMNDGQKRIVKITRQVTTNTDGELVMVGTNVDVTEEYAAVPFAAMAEVLNVSFGLRSLQGEWSFVSAGAVKMFGGSRAEIMHKKSGLLVHFEDGEVYQDLFDKIAHQGEFSALAEVRYKGGDERVVHTLTETYAVRGASGDLVGVAYLFKDIGELARVREEQEALESRMMESSKLESLGVLAGGIAHDFNNLLSGIMAAASMASRSEAAAQDKNLALDLKDIEDAAERAAQLCSQLLAYSGRGRVLVQNANLNEAMDELRSLLLRSVGRNTQLLFDLDPKLAMARVDLTQIQQVLMNLVINASEALPESGGRVLVQTRDVSLFKRDLLLMRFGEQCAPGRYVKLSVSDTGCGIRDTSKIFDPFFTTKFTGRGLGLSAVLGIVRGHGGALHVRSSPGEGTAFEIVLPAVEADRREEAGAREPEGLWCGEGEALIIDDERGVRRGLSRLLGRCGYRVALAESGEDGLALFAEDMERFAVIFVDITMPGLNGFEVVKRLKRMRREQVVVLMSGYAKAEATGGLAEDLLDGFLPKPFTIERVSRVLRGALS